LGLWLIGNHIVSLKIFWFALLTERATSRVDWTRKFKAEQ